MTHTSVLIIRGLILQLLSEDFHFLVEEAFYLLDLGLSLLKLLVDE
jgi:hypothetical protein